MFRLRKKLSTYYLSGKNHINHENTLPTIVRVIKSRRMRWAGHVESMEGKSCVEDFGEKPEGKRPLGRPRRRWEDNIKADIQEGGCGVWTGLNWLRTETVGTHL
jgi:hypothetical protein